MSAVESLPLPGVPPLPSERRFPVAVVAIDAVDSRRVLVVQLEDDHGLRPLADVEAEVVRRVSALMAGWYEAELRDRHRKA